MPWSASLPRDHAWVADAETEAPAGPAAAPPLVDTPERRDALDCPLCGYSLRGLSGAAEPKCPECGYRFEWGELLRARQFAHPFLFEHHPRRNVRALLRTLAAGFVPRRFWSSLNAGHEIRPGRLFVYWLVVAVVTFLAGAGGALAVHGSMAYYQGVVWMRGGPRVSVWSPVFFDDVMRTVFGGYSVELYLLLAALAWPWLTMATLLVFRASMRRVRVRLAHVLRCVVYCGDVFAWIGAALAAVAVLRYYGWLTPRMWDDSLSDRQAATSFLVLFAIATCRLGVAYRRYLRFHRPWATALASQVVVFLFLTTVLSIIYRDVWKLMPTD